MAMAKDKELLEIGWLEVGKDDGFKVEVGIGDNVPANHILKPLSDAVARGKERKSFIGQLQKDGVRLTKPQ
ncbi:hypothetical protein U1Q18_011165 [Sarracenia purpurea var. burkii]